MCGYRTASKLLKGKFNRLTGRVIDLDKEIAIIFKQYPVFSLLNIAERKKLIRVGIYEKY
jgi:hypothetical protein